MAFLELSSFNVFIICYYRHIFSQRLTQLMTTPPYPRRSNSNAATASMSRKRPASRSTPQLVPLFDEEEDSVEWHTVNRPSTAAPNTSNNAAVRKQAIEKIKAKIASGVYTTQVYGRHGAEKIFDEFGKDAVGRRCSRCHNIFMHDNQHFRDHVNICAFPEVDSAKKASESAAKKPRQEPLPKELIESLVSNRRLLTNDVAFERVGKDVGMPVEDVKRTWQCLNKFLGVNIDRDANVDEEDEASVESDLGNQSRVQSSATPNAIKAELTEQDMDNRSEFDATIDILQQLPIHSESSNGPSQQLTQSSNGIHPTSSGKPNHVNKQQSHNLPNDINDEGCPSSSNPACSVLHRRLLEAKIKQVETETTMLRQRQMLEMELIRQRMKCELEKHELEMKRLR